MLSLFGSKRHSFSSRSTLFRASRTPSLRSCKTWEPFGSPPPCPSRTLLSLTSWRGKERCRELFTRDRAPGLAYAIFAKLQNLGTLRKPTTVSQSHIVILDVVAWKRAMSGTLHPCAFGLFALFVHAPLAAQEEEGASRGTRKLTVLRLA